MSLLSGPPHGPSHAPGGVHEAGPRRHFLVEFAALAVGALVGVVPFLSGFIVACDPLRRKTQSGGVFIRVAALEAVPDDGVPRSFPVVADRVDAWNFYAQERLGAVYLRREKGSAEVVAFQATCPHAGCFVAFLAAEKVFRCPCHNSAFAVAGERLHESNKENPAPRDLDTLEVDAEKLASKQEVWVKFENFRTGISEKIASA